MPRSPSRDLSDRFSGNRAYFRRLNIIQRGKLIFTFFALCLFWGFWLIPNLMFPSSTTEFHTHGPLSNPHAIWDRDCAACHREHSASEVGPGSVLNARARWRDLTCEKCHTGAAHNSKVDSEGMAFHADCSSCHHEHAGRNNSLVLISDDHCTQCHANLSPWHINGSPKCAATITSFVGDHPEFRPLTVPPKRTLKFSHALHMTPGQVATPGGKEAMTATRISELSGDAAADRYRKAGQGDGEPIALDCASCHRLDNGAGTAAYAKLNESLDARGEPSKSVLLDRAAGANFLPVNFEASCRACHPLKAPAGASGGNVIAGFDVPHRKQPADLMSELNAGYMKGLVAANHAALAVPIGPGEPLDPPPARTIREEADRLTASAHGMLLADKTGCAKCHDVADTKIAAIPDRTVWLPAAKFNHIAHRAATCATCHPGTAAAFPPAGTALIEKESAQILGIDSCRACHSPAGTRVTLPDGTAITGGGIRHACVDCHRYHNGDHALQGRGAAAMFPAQPLGLSEFLRGKKD